MTVLLHLLLAGAITVLVLVFRPVLVAVLGRAQNTAHPVAELRRLWRKEPTRTGMAVAALGPGALLACDATALVLVPTVLPALPEPFGNLPVVFGLLLVGRLLAALAAFEAGDGQAASRSSLFLAAAGPAVVLVTLVVGGAGGSAGLLPMLSTLHDAGGPMLPVALCAAGVAVLGWADLLTGPDPEAFAFGPALAVLRASAALRCAAWIDLVAVLLPPAAPDALWQAVLAWAAKGVILLVALAGAEAAWGRAERPVAAPALAGLLGLLGALLLALRGSAA